jgi:hypothetical protein
MLAERDDGINVRGNGRIHERIKREPAAQAGRGGVSPDKTNTEPLVFMNLRFPKCCPILAVLHIQANLIVAYTIGPDVRPNRVHDGIAAALVVMHNTVPEYRAKVDVVNTPCPLS